MADYLLIGTGEYLLLDSGGDRLLLQSDAIPGKDAGAGPAKRRRYRSRIEEEDEELMKMVEAILSKIDP